MKENRLSCNYIRVICLVTLVGIVSISFEVSLGQQPDAPKPEAKTSAPTPQTGNSDDKPDFKLTVKTKPIINLSLKAEKVKLVDVAEEMAQKLKTPVFVGPTLKDEIISIEFNDLTLEPAMQLMAPAVYIDYVIDSGSAMAPKPLGIFFYGANQGEPPVTAVVPGITQSLLIEGDTEEGIEPTTDEQRKKLEEQPLRIQFQNNILSVKAKKQPLTLVLLKIGEELGVPVDIQYEAQDLVDTEITKLSVEDAVRKLSPNIRLFLRASLSVAERRALRLVLADPAKTAQGL